MKKDELFYVAPEVEVVEVVIEKGFAATEQWDTNTGNGSQGEGVGL